MATSGNVQHYPLTAAGRATRIGDLHVRTVRCSSLRAVPLYRSASFSCAGSAHQLPLNIALYDRVGLRATAAVRATFSATLLVVFAAPAVRLNLVGSGFRRSRMFSNQCDRPQGTDSKDSDRR